jgi:hypothetical protein
MSHVPLLHIASLKIRRFDKVGKPINNGDGFLGSKTEWPRDVI